jgi:hypothetical protein
VLLEPRQLRVPLGRPFALGFFPRLVLGPRSERLPSPVHLTACLLLGLDPHHLTHGLLELTLDASVMGGVLVPVLQSHLELLGPEPGGLLRFVESLSALMDERQALLQCVGLIAEFRQL